MGGRRGHRAQIYFGCRRRRSARWPCGARMNSEEYIASEEQKHIDMLWSARNVVTGGDLDWLADLKIIYGGCCGLETNCAPEWRICMSCGQPADNFGYCSDMREFMECD